MECQNVKMSVTIASARSEIFMSFSVSVNSSVTFHSYAQNLSVINRIANRQIMLGRRAVCLLELTLYKIKVNMRTHSRVMSLLLFNMM